MWIACPVINEASSEARNTQALAISNGSPMRFTGIFWARSSADQLGYHFFGRSVFIAPGDMVLTVIPYEAYSKATALVNPWIPAFAVTLCALFAKPLKPSMPEI